MTHLKIGRTLVLAFVLTAGVATVWVIIAVWMTELVGQAWRSSIRNYSIVVQADGTPLIQHYHHFYDHVSDIHFEYLSLEGKLIHRGPSAGESLTGAPVWVSELREPLFGFGRLEWSSRTAQFQGGSVLSQDAGRVLSQNNVIWHFIHDGLEDGSGYFVGYELVGNRCIGYLGIDGFSQIKPARESCFAMTQRDYISRIVVLFNVYSSLTLNNEVYDATRKPLFVQSGGKILSVELAQRSVRTIFEDPSILRMSQMTRPRTPTEDSKRRTEPAIAVRMPARIAIVSLEGDAVTEYLLPESIRPRNASFYVLPKDQGLLVEQRTDRVSGEVSATLWWIDRAGNLLDEREAVLGQTTPRTSPWVDAAIGAAIFPAPGIMVPGLMFVGAPLMEQDRHPGMSYWQAVGPAFAQVWPVIAGLVLLGALLGWLCIRRQKKYALPWTKTWAVFVFIFGLPGYLAYLCHRRWPVREECGQCHAAAPQDRGACAFCDAPFPDPAPKGIEVFA